LLPVLAFESIDEPHIQWLQMACAIGGGKNIILIFFRAMVSLGCAVHWSMKSKIFNSLPLPGDPIAQETQQ
jgi:hypothetical protein